MGSNVIPSAPEPSIYHQLPQHYFMMQKANKIAASLDAEVAHYRAVAKKYKRAKKIVNCSATGTGLISAACSTASFGSALSVIGIPVAIPLGGVGGTFALASSGLIFVSKKLDSKIKKHHEIATLAIAKLGTVNWLLSKSLSDNQISNSEFQLIMDEYSQYNVLKEAVRSKITRNPDIEKIKKNARREVEAEFQKKLNALVGVSN